MKLPRRTRQVAIALAALTALIGVTGCSAPAEPEPTPTTLVFATDEEAYAAAEEVYREFLDTYNSLDYADSGAYNEIKEYITGRYADAERKGLSEAHADGITKQGESSVIWFKGVSRSEDTGITAIVCDDISDIARFNADGSSRVHPDRPDTLARRLTFAEANGRLQIEDAQLASDPDCLL